jgi:sugar phosphate permease
MLDPSRISVKKFARTQEDNQDIPEIKFCEAFGIFGLLQFAISFFFIKFAFYGVYYWIPSYLQQVLFYSKKQATDIMSLGSIGGIIGSILMGTISDLLVVRSPVHTIGCVLGSISLLLLVSVQTNTHTAFLTGCMTSFSLFEGGATIVIAVVLCDIGKDELLRRKRRAVATISGINDGIAGFGSIIG